jgi:hypothetical protein
MDFASLGTLVSRVIAWADGVQQRHSVFGFPYAVIKKYGDDDGGREAALITYYGFLSIFPLLLLGVAILSRVLAANPDLRRQLIDATVPEALQSTVEHSAATFPTSTVPFVAGLIGLLFSGTGVVFSAYQTLNHVAAVPRSVRAGFFPRYIRVFVMLAALLLGALAVGALTVVVTALPDLAGVERAVAALGSALVIFGVLLLGARLLLCRPAPFSALWPAAAGRRDRDPGDQPRAGAAGEAGEQGRGRLRQLRHRGGHVRPALPGQPGAALLGRGRRRPVRPPVATRPGCEPPDRGRRPRHGPARPRAGTHPGRRGGSPPLPRFAAVQRRSAGTARSWFVIALELGRLILDTARAGKEAACAAS